MVGTFVFPFGNYSWKFGLPMLKNFRLPFTLSSRAMSTQSPAVLILLTRLGGKFCDVNTFRTKSSVREKYAWALSWDKIS